MSDKSITVVGLGPGRRALLTVEALEALRAAPRLYLHASQAALLDELNADLRPDVEIHVFGEQHDPARDNPLPSDPITSSNAADHVPDTAGAATSASTHVVQTLLAAAAESPLVYAVSGHPAEHAAVRLLCGVAAERGIAVRVVAGLSCLDAVAAAAPIDVDAGVQVVDALAFASRDGDAERGLQDLWTAPSSRLLDAQAPLVITGIPDDAALTAVARRLLDRYPPTHEVTLLRGAGPVQTVTTLPLSDLGSTERGDQPATPGTTGSAGFQPALVQPTGAGKMPALPVRALQPRSRAFSLYLPPLAPLDDARAPNTLGYITARLRAPGGCPWDREQTHASLTTYMIEEAYEAVDAIERDDTADMVEELGDVLLQVVLHSQLAQEEGRFSLADVAEEVNRKLVRRHPHVFGDVSVDSSSEVLRNWERIKRAEKGERRASALDGIPAALPALALAQTVGRKAAKYGFDWPDVTGTLDKVREEIGELQRATSDTERRDEMGDLLFALTSVCRHLGLDAEDALRGAVRKFSDRFRRVEALASARRLDLAALDLPALDALWNEAKADQE